MEAGVPIMNPPVATLFISMHGSSSPIFRRWSTPASHWRLNCTKQGGIRGCEIGTAMFGLRPDGQEEPAHMDLVRLAIPRRDVHPGTYGLCDRSGDRSVRKP